MKINKRKAPKNFHKKTKFQEFLDMEGNKDTNDLETERRLARKLKVRAGKLCGVDDGLNDLFGDISYVLDPGADGCEGEGTVAPRKKHKRKRHSAVLENKLQEQLVSSSKIPHDIEMNKYVAPHLRTSACRESEELAQTRRRVRGLLNKLSESNVESITEEIAVIFRSIPRSDGFHIINQEVISSCVNGPRGNEQHAAVFAAFVAGMACLVGMDFSARLLASLAMGYERESVKEDNLSLRNITLLISYLYMFGVCSSDLIFDFLSVMSRRMSESDVSTVLAILQCCGMKLRSDDPTGMKDFILRIQNRASELQCSSGSSDAYPKINNKRMEFMLQTILEIKNNKKREKEEPVHHTRIKKWLQKLKAGDILLRGIRWARLLDTEKKGQWWLSGDIASVNSVVEDVAVHIDKEVLEAQKLIQLAAVQRMNTDIRRAIFCVIMSGEDYLDAFEKILRLDLSGKQDREIMRVLVECCLQEKSFNKYYVVLASKLCSHDKNHKFTLQYCLWDQFKELDSMELRRSMNLAKFVAEMLSSFTLSLVLLKAVDLADPKQLTPKRIMHFRILFETIFENSDAAVWNIFTRVAALPESETLRQNLQFFIKKFVIVGDSGKAFNAKFQIAKKALENIAGVLM